MKILHHLMAVAILTVSTIATPQLSLAASAERISVIESKFGVLFTAKEKAPRLIRVVEVPNAEGTAYGWILRIKKGEKPSEISEVLRMPAPAKNVHVNVAKTSLSKDGRTLTTRIDVDASEEVIGNFWTVAPDDPIGQYTIEIKQSGAVLAKFDFEIVKKSKEEVLRSSLEIREREYFARVAEGTEQPEASSIGPIKDCEKRTYDRACLIENATASLTAESSGLSRVLEYFGRESDGSARRLMTLTRGIKPTKDGYAELEPFIHASSYYIVNGDEKAATIERDRFVDELEKVLRQGNFSNKADNIMLYCATIASAPKAGAALWIPVVQKYCNLKKLDELAFGLDSAEKNFMPLLKAIVAAHEKNEEVYKENIAEALSLVDTMRRYATTSMKETGASSGEMKNLLDRYYIFLARASFFMGQSEVGARVLSHVNRISEEFPSLPGDMDSWIDLRTETAIQYLRHGKKEMAKELVVTLTKIGENKKFRNSAVKAFACAAILRQRIELEESRPQPQKGPELPTKGQNAA